MSLDDAQLEVDPAQSRQSVSTWPLCECDVPAKSSYIKSHCKICGRRLVKPRGKKKNG
mgnify:CR=1 FL=1